MAKTAQVELTAGQRNVLLELAKQLLAEYVQEQEADFRRFMQIVTVIQGEPRNPAQEAKRAILATQFVLLHGAPTRPKVEAFLQS